MKPKEAASLCLLSLWVGMVGCGSGSSSLKQQTAPSISISPVSAVAGSSDLVLDVTGPGFANETHDTSVVVWSANGKDSLLATTFISSTHLTAVIPAALLANPVTANVLVETGDPIGSLPLSKSNSVGFSVVAISSEFSITSISPMTIIAGSPDLALTVMGSGFANVGPHNRSFVVWSANGKDSLLATTFISSTELTAVIPAALLANPVTAKVSVETGDLAGSFPLAQSNSINFTVTSP